MSTVQCGRLVRQLRSVLARQDMAGLTDADLWQRYLRERNEAAFETLVRRHGPMVMGVCRRILRNEQDAEDAFQATFLVLVRRAAVRRSPITMANWLHGVAPRSIFFRPWIWHVPGTCLIPAVENSTCPLS